MYDEETQELYQFYFLSYNGNEGSAADLYEQFDNGYIDPEDYKQLAYILEDEGMNEEAKQVRKAMEEVKKMILVLAGMAVMCSALVVGYGVLMALLFLAYKATGGKLNFKKWKNICKY